MQFFLHAPTVPERETDWGDAGALSLKSKVALAGEGVVEFGVNVTETEQVALGAMAPAHGFWLVENGPPDGEMDTLLMVRGAVPLLVTVTLCVAELPTDTSVNVRAVVLKEMAGAVPVPLSGTTCGEPAALSAIERLAETAPDAVGVKVTVMGQVACGAMLAQLAAGEALKKDDPAMVTAVMAKALLPVLVTVMVWLVLGPTFWLPKGTLVGFSEMPAARPVPDRATDCGEPGALSAMERVAEKPPSALGVNVSAMEQLVCGAMLVQLPAAVAPKKAEPVLTEVMVKGRLPLLETIRDWLPEALTFWLPKLTVAVESVMAGPRPVPVSAMVCGEPAALSAMEIWAERAPMAVGVKVTLTPQTAPAARVGRQLPAEKSLGLLPVREKEVMVRAAVPLLVIVRVWAGLVVPTFSETRERLGAERVTTGEGAPPVPLRVTD